MPERLSERLEPWLELEEPDKTEQHETFEERAIRRGVADYYPRAVGFVASEEFRRRTESLAIRYGASPSDAPDVSQMSAEKILRYPELMDKDSILQLVVRQQVIVVYRKERGRKSERHVIPSTPELDASGDHNEYTAFGAEVAGRILQGDFSDDVVAVTALGTVLGTALNRLSARHREVLVRRFYADQEKTTIALSMGSSAETVTGQVHWGLKKMRARLGSLAAVLDETV